MAASRSNGFVEHVPSIGAEFGGVTSGDDEMFVEIPEPLVELFSAGTSRSDMELISVARRGELIGKARSVIKAELRDNYAVDRKLFVAWRAGDADAVARAAEASRDKAAARVAAGMSLRRAKVVSEPLSEYQRFAFDYSAHAVDAGEDIRWVPRRLVSTVLLPGNDFFVLDDELVIFNVLDGADDRAEQQLYRDADVVKRCRDSFDAAWAVSIPHREYQPR